MLHILTQYKTVRDRYFGSGVGPPATISTFWNPLDSHRVTLSNSNYTATVDTPDDFTRPHAGWDNLEITTGKWYWEVQIEQCTATGAYPHLSFGLRSAYDGMAINIASGPISGSYEARQLRYNSDSGGSIVTTTIPDIAVWHSNTGTAPNPVHALAEIQGNYLVVDATGVSGFSAGDILMFAFDRDAGNFWIGKNGTWFNSGDPAAGTGAQFTNMDTSEAQYEGVEIPWRFFFATTGTDYSATPLKFHLATGTNLVPQTYAAPSGFTDFTDPSTMDVQGNFWSYRDSSGDWMSISTGLYTSAFAGGTLALGTGSNYAFSVGQMQLGGKYYWEMLNTTVAAQQHFGIALVGNGGTGNTTTGTVCLWGQGGGLTDGAASITMDTTGVSGWSSGDDQMFAVDLDAGKMWIGTNGTWFNSGDPAAGTNPQFSGLPLTGPWYAKGVITAGARDAAFSFPGTYNHATPSGFTTTIPVVVEYVP